MRAIDKNSSADACNNAVGGITRESTNLEPKQKSGYITKSMNT